MEAEYTGRKLSKCGLSERQLRRSQRSHGDLWSMNGTLELSHHVYTPYPLVIGYSLPLRVESSVWG